MWPWSRRGAVADGALLDPHQYNRDDEAGRLALPHGWEVAMDAAWNLGAWIAAIGLAAVTITAVIALFIAGWWPVGAVAAVALAFALLGRWDALESSDVGPDDRSVIAERLGVSDR